MNWLCKLPNSRRHPPGLVWRLLRCMPHILVLGTVLPALVALAARLIPHGGTARVAAATLKLIDIYAISAIILHWTIVLTVAIACVIVWLMKGPAYVADAYPLPDADRPSPGPRDLTEFSAMDQHDSAWLAALYQADPRGIANQDPSIRIHGHRSNQRHGCDPIARPHPGPQRAGEALQMAKSGCGRQAIGALGVRYFTSSQTAASMRSHRVLSTLMRA